MSDAIDCREARERLQDYLKEELTVERAAEVAAHLERCRHCFSQAKFEESFLLMLRIKSQRTCCPNALKERILAALRAEREPG
jgi:anti-sigma factor (TIGR02949 family)